jgi:hypothetical protein
VRARVRRLAKRAKDSRAAATFLEEQWSREACRHLSDRELKLLQQALHRGFDPCSEHQGVIVTEEKWAAYERFARFYEEARRGA